MYQGYSLCDPTEIIGKEAELLSLRHDFVTHNL